MSKLTKDEAMNLLKSSFTKLMSFSVQKFQDIPLQDGTKLCIDDTATLDVDTPIYQVDDKGVQTPVNDGDYALTDGRVVTVKDGKVASIAAKPSEAADETTTPVEEAAEDMAAPAPTPVADTDGDAAADADLANRVTQLEQTLEQLMEMLQGMMNSQEISLTKLSEVEGKVKDFSRAPAAEPIKLSKQPYSILNKENNFTKVADDVKKRQELMSSFRKGSRTFLADSKS